METVGIPILDSEQVIVYAPNYLKRLKQILAKYTKRSGPKGLNSTYFLSKIIRIVWVLGTKNSWKSIIHFPFPDPFQPWFSCL